MDWDFNDEVVKQVEELLSLLITSVPEPISMDEVADRLAELRPKKAPGADGVSNTALRRLREQRILFLVTLFNACLSLAYFRQKWRKATVIMILKP